MNSSYTVPDKVSARITSINDVLAERDAQDAKWGEQNHADGTGPRERLLDGNTYADLAEHAKDVTDIKALYKNLTFADILVEEVLEALAESDPMMLRTELVQVAAVAVQWVEAIDRRPEAAL